MTESEKIDFTQSWNEKTQKKKTQTEKLGTDLHNSIFEEIQKRAQEIHDEQTALFRKNIEKKNDERQEKERIYEEKLDKLNQDNSAKAELIEEIKEVENCIIDPKIDNEDDIKQKRQKSQKSSPIFQKIDVNRRDFKTKLAEYEKLLIELAKTKHEKKRRNAIIEMKELRNARITEQNEQKNLYLNFLQDEVKHLKLTPKKTDHIRSLNKTEKGFVGPDFKTEKIFDEETDKDIDFVIYDNRFPKKISLLYVGNKDKLIQFK
ncbi:hypothetical protein M0811_09617 [Anaeramoeba ignava]|uniref:Uncharacterized protein n=1 Tax=Anaeramoeba ignava TaxID=1746090 RepID=A0A9Q0R9L7_ANAIG|nr:hypothetical protein M0811_09617 [Anaeramoeba ignava]